ncbi:MAG: mechanosensitive ion channel family protein, partial [Gammaproteobacteria bacterium]|nr:mechanosensitive ion channel family protein [Gammaproteobacteria bacterium]
MNQPLDQVTAIAMGYLTTYGMNVLGAIVTLIVGYAIAGWLSGLTDRAMRKSAKIDPVFHALPGKIVRITILVFT